MKIIAGGLAVDKRGIVSFVNDFDFKGVKRFYVVENHEVGKVRAWHGHKKEGKYVYVVAGVARIGIWDMETQEIHYEVLAATSPRILYIPPGNYNGSQSLAPNTKIIYFSTSTLEESKEDDFRREVDSW